VTKRLECFVLSLSFAPLTKISHQVLQGDLELGKLTLKKAKGIARRNFYDAFFKMHKKCHCCHEYTKREREREREREINQNVIYTFKIFFTHHHYTCIYISKQCSSVILFQVEFINLLQKIINSLRGYKYLIVVST